MRKFVLFVMAALLILAGCAKRQTVQTPEQGQAGATAGAKKAESKDLSSESVTGKNLPAGQQAGAQPAFKEMDVKIQDIRFDFDRYDVRDDAKPVLKNVAALLGKNTKAKAVIEGHCDERGTGEYNLALGDKRANAAKAYLVSLGIPSARIDTVSYGKEKPLCTESTEDCWAKNRRDHFVLNEPR